MRSVSLGWLSLVLATLPLFAGCGGCGGAPSVDQMRAARGSWGADDDEVAAAQPPKASAAQPARAEKVEQVEQVEEAPEEPAPKTPRAQVAAEEPAKAQTAPQRDVELPEAPAAEPAETAIASEASVERPAPPATPSNRNARTPQDSADAVPSEPQATGIANAPVPVEVDGPVEPGRAAPAENMLATASDAGAPGNPVVSVAIEAESPPPSDQVSLLPQAQALADAGKETEADRMLLGEALLRDRLEEWPFRMRWSPALRRPAPWLRAGIAFAVTTVSLDGDHVGAIPAKDRALERDFGDVGRDVLNLGGELAERTLGEYLMLLRAGKLGPTLAPNASGEVDAGRRLPVRVCGGLMVFGPGEERLLKAHAERLGLDLLLIFDVRAKRNPEDPKLPVNDTSFRIVDVVDDRELYSSPSVRNVEVAAARRNPVATDPVDAVMQDVAAYLDTQLPLQEVPSEIRPEHVRNRLPKLIDQALVSKNALPYLVEIKALYLQGYLAGLEARDAYVAILGEAGGNAVYSGSPDERLQALERLLPPLRPLNATASHP